MLDKQSAPVGLTQQERKSIIEHSGAWVMDYIDAQAARIAELDSSLRLERQQLAQITEIANKFKSGDVQLGELISPVDFVQGLLEVAGRLKAAEAKLTEAQGRKEKYGKSDT